MDHSPSEIRTRQFGIRKLYKSLRRVVRSNERTLRTVQYRL